MKKVLVATVLLVVLGGLAVGCDSDDDDGDAASTEETRDSIYDDDAGDADETETPPVISEGAALLEVGETSLGMVLVDAEGHTLYLFTNDVSDQSTCTGGCLDIWPPLYSNGDPQIGDGVDESLVGVATQADGAEQVTYNGALLYRFADDAAPGDVEGQGVGGVWFAMLASGEPASS